MKRDLSGTLLLRVRRVVGNNIGQPRCGLHYVLQSLGPEVMEALRTLQNLYPMRPLGLGTTLRRSSDHPSGTKITKLSFSGRRRVI